LCCEVSEPELISSLAGSTDAALIFVNKFAIFDNNSVPLKEIFLACLF
jgi:hypothetical protein